MLKYIELVRDALGIEDLEELLAHFSSAQLDVMHEFYLDAEKLGEALDYPTTCERFADLPEMVLFAENLAKSREQEAITKDLIAELEGRLLETEDGKTLAAARETLKVIKGEREVADSTLRDKVLSHWQNFGDTKPIPGVEIKMMADVVEIVDLDKATQWARKNALCLLTLDEKRFKRFVQSFPDLLPYDVATIDDQPKPYINSNLAIIYLQPEEE